MSAESGEQCFPDFLFSGFCIAWKIKMKKNLFIIISILVCCTGVFAQKIPSWVEKPSESFPEKTYITAVGDGRTKNQAEVNAIEKLAAVFGRDISSETKSTSRMVQARADGSVVTAEASGIERDVVQKVNAEDLVGVEIKDTCKDGKTYYAIAVMNRESARTAIISEINKNEPEIIKILAMKVSDKKSMENYSRLSLAHETAVYDEKLLKKLDVLDSKEADSLRKSVTSSLSVKKELLSVASQIPVCVSVVNDPMNVIRPAFCKMISDVGFNTSDNKKERYCLEATCILLPRDTKDKKTFQVNYTLEGYLRDTASGKEMMPVSIKGRASSVDSSDVLTRTYRAIEKKIETQVTEDFRNFLGSIK